MTILRFAAISAVVLAVTLGTAKAETIRVAIGTQDTTINCATGGLLIRVAPLDVVGRVLVFAADSAEKYPEIVMAYLRAALEADRLIAAEPERYSELISKVTGIEVEVVYLFHGPLGCRPATRPGSRNSERQSPPRSRRSNI